jgi:hypothetical protein
MKAHETCNQFLQSPIPNNQWQKEVTIWFSTALAKEQAWAVEWASGLRNIDGSVISLPQAELQDAPTSKQLVAQCHAQLVRDSSSFMNFSVLGLVLVLVLGGVIILLGLSTDTVVGWIRTRKGRKVWKAEQWHNEETLALQKAANERAGLWKDGGNESTSSPVFVEKVSGGSSGIESSSGTGKGYTPVSVEPVDADS